MERAVLGATLGLPTSLSKSQTGTPISTCPPAQRHGAQAGCSGMLSPGTLAAAEATQP